MFPLPMGGRYVRGRSLFLNSKLRLLDVRSKYAYS